MSLLIGKKYELKSLLGNGSFGEVYLGVNVNNDEEVAVKLEKSDNGILKYEARMYTLLKGVKGIPKIRGFGKQDDYYYLSMDRLGVPVDYLVKNTCKSKMKREILLVGMQLVNILEKVHDAGIIHRDIKPENVLLRYSKSYTTTYNALHLIDFGLSKLYKDVPVKHNEKITGNLRYASVNIHQRITPSRRDDLLSLGYLLIYLQLGHLPWQHLRSDNDKLIYQMKKDINLIELETYPEICEYIEICNNLSYSAVPPYTTLYNIFRNNLKHI